MNKGTLDTLNNFRFFTDRGTEVHAQRNYQLTWRMKPSRDTESLFRAELSGYFIADIDYAGGNYGIDAGTMSAEVLGYGDIYMPSGYEGGVSEYIAAAVFDFGNEVEVKVDIRGASYTNTFNASLVFDDDEDYYSPENEGVTFTMNKVYTGDHRDGEYHYIIRLLSLPLRGLTDEPGTPYIHEALTANVPNIGLYFPFVIYSGAFVQDKVSTGFIAATTVLALMDRNGDSGSFVTPALDEGYVLEFRTQEPSELFIVETDDYQVLRRETASFDLTDTAREPLPDGRVEPLQFTVGFQTDEEGCYQNHIGMYLRNKDNGKEFFFGVLTVKTEVEGEDERFRTFMTNFGVPDPAHYSNLFNEQEYDEECRDYTLINRKSKELFLSYDQIFPYAGTYKALINAINFLGYKDIVFKEWYRITDSNDQLRDVAVQTVDFETGRMLKNVLSEYGISMEDYESYDKLNRLSMIYHLNEIVDGIPDEQKVYRRVPLDITRFAGDIRLTGEQRAIMDECGYLDPELLDERQLDVLDSLIEEWIDSREEYAGAHANDERTALVWDIPVVEMLDVPFTRPIFTYRNDEIVAKLFGVKDWLERHIVGLNAYISDISAEGVFVNRYKTQTYLTQHPMDDFTTEAYFTPTVREVGEFRDSSAVVTCTLNEFTALTFDDYEGVAVDNFKRHETPLEFGCASDVSVLRSGSTFECPVLADEYMFTLTNRPDSGTMFEFTEPGPSQILVQDMEVRLLCDSSTSAVARPDALPLIDLEIANIRRCHGRWTDNVEWSVREVVDQETGNTEYELNNIGSGRWDVHYATSNRHILLRPDCDFSNRSGCYKITDERTDTMFAFVEGRYYNCVDETYNLDPDTGVYAQEPYGDYVKSGDEYVEIPQDDTFIYYARKVCSFEYTSDTKWHCPMFVISGYRFDGVDIPEQWSDLYDMGETNRYVVEVVKGRFLFNDANIGAEIVFSDDAGKMTSREQYVKAKYDYMSDKVPFIELRDASVAEQAALVAPESDGGGRDALEELYRRQLLDGIDEGTAAYDVYEEHVAGAPYTGMVDEFVEKKAELSERRDAYDEYMRIYDENYRFNDHIDVAVTRLGDYELQVSAFDRYNNIFSNKSDDRYPVEAAPIGYSVLMNQEWSDNGRGFYRFNRAGDLLDSSAMEELGRRLDDRPLFPRTYRIFDIECAKDSSRLVEYTNITYAIDTPKRNDYFVCTDLTEVCTGCDYDSSAVRLTMLDENPDRVDLYRRDASVAICVFDDNLMEEVDTLGPLRVVDYFRQDSSTDMNYADDSWILVDCAVTDSSFGGVGEFMSMYEDELVGNRLSCYLLDVSEYEIGPDDFSNDYASGTCDVAIKGAERHFSDGDVVKMRYYLKEDGRVLGETAYRITGVRTAEEGMVYTIDGYLDGIRLSGVENNYSKAIGLRMMRPYKRPVRYTVRVDDDALEYSRPSGYYGYNILRTQFHYNNAQMFINDYLDDTFSGYIYDYDQQNLKDAWDDSFFTSADGVYAFAEFPVTIPQGRHIMAVPDEEDRTFAEGYKVEWRWSCRTFDDVDNWDEHDNTNDAETWFRSVNRYLQLAPTTLGHNSLEMTCTDLYGNRLVNRGSGRICIKEKN